MGMRGVRGAITVEKNEKAAIWQAAKAMMQELIERGYQNFLMIGADPSKLSTRIERSSGFIDCITESGYSFQSLEIRDGEINHDEILSFVKKNLKENVSTLVYVPNCWALPEVCDALQNLRDLIPQKLGIIGFDNTEWASFSSP